MPRLKRQNEAIKDERRQEIMLAATPLFAIYSPLGVTMDMVADEAKCSHGLLYHYFHNVDEIYQNIVNSLEIKNLKEKLFLVREEVTAGQELYIITKKLIDNLGLDRISSSRLLLVMNENGTGSLREHLAKLIKEGQNEKDVVGGDPDDVAKTYLLVFKGYLLNYLLIKKYNEDRPNIDVVYEIFKKRSRI